MKLGLPLPVLVLALAATSCGERREGDPVVNVSVSAPAIDFDLPDFSLVDQHDKPFRRADLNGRVWVVDFIFTSCPSICPELTKRMAWLTKELEADPDVSFLSISVDPENDTPAKLLEFQRKNGEITPRWTFLTGDPVVVEKTVLSGFKMALSRGGADGHGATNIFHAERFLVLDKKAHVRGVFDSKGDGLIQLKERVRALSRE